MESIEIQPGPTREKAQKESGYSEKDQVQQVEGSAIDIKQIKKRVAASSVTKKDKILSAYQKISDTVNDLVRSISLLPTGNVRQVDLLLGEIREHRKKQDELVTMLLLEQEGTLTEKSVSEDMWRLLE